MPATLTASQLQEFLPALVSTAMWADALEAAMARSAITTPPRAAAFLAQIAVESMELTHLVENLNYSAKRLMTVWPKRFPTLTAAVPYARDPEKLANYVYAKRLGNGDSSSGDGWRFRGRGLLQHTGRGRYREAGAALGIPLEEQPELLETPPVAAAAAAYYWKSRGCNELADDRNDDNDDEDFVRISILINGGRTGLDARRAYWTRAQQALGQFQTVT